MKQYILIILFSLVSLFSYSQIPSITLKTIDNKTIKTDTLSNNGKPFVISFFASWCKPCNRELSNISDVYEDWVNETGMKLFAVSIDEGQNTQKVKPFVDNHGWEYDVLLDPNSDFRRALGISMIPHTLIFDGNGKCIWSHSGYQDGGEEEIIKIIKKIESEN